MGTSISRRYDQVMRRYLNRLAERLIAMQKNRGCTEESGRTSVDTESLSFGVPLLWGNPSDQYREDTRRRSAGEDGPMGHTPQVKDNTYTVLHRPGMNRSILQFRMKKLGIARAGREDDASVASEAQWGTEWQALA